MKLRKPLDDSNARERVVFARRFIGVVAPSDGPIDRVET
jgi:hypothetical protein